MDNAQNLVAVLIYARHKPTDPIGNEIISSRYLYSIECTYHVCS
jgi:hypothetical protein